MSRSGFFWLGQVCSVYVRLGAVFSGCQVISV